ncbi:MAG: threonine synthase [Rhodospirillaceae bacterium]
MRYVSTRGRAPDLGFDDVLLAGLATDGGLYVPAAWPRFSAAEIKGLIGLDYAGLAERIMAPFMAGSVLAPHLGAICREAYGRFSHPAVAPLRQLAPNQWIMELFCGPTLAFKDYALQVVGLMFERLLAARGGHITIVGATSGDTGSAAIEACRGRKGIDICILHPAGRTSDVQRRQMTTVAAANVHNIAVEGTFDDCQDIVKALFADAKFRADANLSAVNSINWARIMAQVVYYFWAALHLGAPDREVAFVVPTGNFGNVFAGFVASRMGLPVAKFVVGSNRNDILTRYFETGSMTAAGVVPTLSPSMDIQISSNFERLLFDMGGRDPGAVERAMAGFKQSGGYDVEPRHHQAMTALFSGQRLDDDGTLAIMHDVFRKTGEQIDPHTAVGVAAMRGADIAKHIPRIALSTAHPAKFPDAVERATGKRPALPPAMADLFNLPEHFTKLPNDLDQVKRFLRDHVMS